MQKHTIPTKALSRFLQLLDGSFPSGVFVHSFGLEAHVVLEKVSSADDLKRYFDNLICDQYQKVEFPFVKKIFALLENEKLPALITEDERFAAMQHFEFAQASQNIGRNYLRHISFDIGRHIVKDYFQAVASEQAIGNELTVLSAYAYELGLDSESLLLLWCKKNLITIASSALKISRIKPSEIQQLLFGFDETLENSIASRSKKIMNFNPLFEQAIYQHLHLEPKLFMT